MAGSSALENQACHFCWAVEEMPRSPAGLDLPFMLKGGGGAVARTECREGEKQEFGTSAGLALPP